MTKTEFIEKIAKKTGYSMEGTEAVVNAFFDTVNDALKEGELDILQNIWPEVVRCEAEKRPVEYNTIVTSLLPQDGLKEKDVEKCSIKMEVLLTE